MEKIEAAEEEARKAAEAEHAQKMKRGRGRPSNGRRATAHSKRRGGRADKGKGAEKAAQKPQPKAQIETLVALGLNETQLCSEGTVAMRV